MSGEFKIERAERTQSRLRLALTASSNGGKTWSAILLAKGIVEHMIEAGVLTGTLEGKIGLLDTERKSAPLYSHLAPFDCVHLDPPYTAERYGKALRVLEAARYPVIIVDQISHAWSGPGGMLALLQKKAQAAYEGNSFRAWGEITPAQDEFIDMLLRSPAHLIVTMRQKTEWVVEQVEGKNGKVRLTPRRIGTKPVQRDGIEYEFTTLLGLDTDTHLARPIKNRCPVFEDGVPVLLDESVGRSLAQWMLGGAPLAAEEAREPTLLEQAEAIAAAAEQYLPQCTTIPDLARRYSEAYSRLKAFWTKLGPEVCAPLMARLVVAKDARKAVLSGSGAIVKDLADEDVKPAPPVGVDIKKQVEDMVTRAGNARGGLFADVQDDLPWRD